jgi:hypothetical protein
MKLREILQQLPQESLENLARERLSQVVDIRLPRTVLVNELAQALASSTFVTTQVALRHPPCFAILNLLMNAADFSLAADGFRQKVQEETDRMVVLAGRSPIFPKPKQYDLYLKMLSSAWALDDDINPSEENLLRVLRGELGISLMEHFVIEHHPDLHRFWRSEQAYENERNHLFGVGILFLAGDRYILAEETVVLIRRAWGFELSVTQFRRLLDTFSNDDMRDILDNEGLNISGSSEEKKSRILENYVLPRAAMESVHIESLRQAARSLGCRTYGTKDEVIENILDWLDSDEDLKAQAVAAETTAASESKEVVPETRELSNDALADLLRRLTNETLYDVLSHLPGQRKSGNKDERVKRLLESPFSERTMLTEVTNEVLHELCRQLDLTPYGPKEEKITRLIDAYRHFTPQSPSLAINVALASNGGDTGKIFLSSPPAAPPATQLPRLPSVRAEYPYLNEAEQTVLSYLLDFKSLSDPELEKLVQRFALPWILPKAQMNELTEKLKANGRDIIRVKSLADHNVYQITP